MGGSHSAVGSVARFNSARTMEIPALEMCSELSNYMSKPLMRYVFFTSFLHHYQGKNRPDLTNIRLEERHIHIAKRKDDYFQRQSSHTTDKRKVNRPLR